MRQTDAPFDLDGRTMARRVADTFSSPRGRTSEFFAQLRRKLADFSKELPSFSTLMSVIFAPCA